MIRLSRAQLREVDRVAVAEYAMPSLLLMENAARNAAQIIDDRHRGDGVDGTTAIVVCGSGNNAGDGYGVARHLHNRGWHVRIVALIAFDHLRSDADTMARIARKMKLPIEIDLPAIHGPADAVVIDAITGTGLSRPLEGELADAVAAINASGRTVVALDVPSGLDCDTGAPLDNACIRATRTISFVAEKIGFANPRASEFTGEITVADIGCPREIVERFVARATSP